MTPDEFRSRIAALGFSLGGFAAFTTTNPRTVERWSSGAQAIPGWVRVMLGLLDERARHIGELRELICSWAVWSETDQAIETRSEIRPAR